MFQLDLLHDPRRRRFNKEGMTLVKSLNELITMHIKLIFPETFQYILPSGHQVLERINNNAYKIDLLGDFSVHSTFNVVDLSHFDVSDDFSDSRTNPFEEGEDDKNHDVPNVPTGSITRSKAKNIQQRGDDPYQVLERINNNAYKIDLPGDFLVHSTSTLSSP